MSNVVEARRAELIEKLGQVHTARLKAESEYLALAGKIKSEREQHARLQAKIGNLMMQLSESRGKRPQVADYLPSAPESIEWRKNHSALEAMHAKLIELDKQSQPTQILDAVRYEGPTGLIATLQYSEANLLTALDPESRRRHLSGGVFEVG